MDKKKQIVEKIAALRSKTTANGCTLEEAMAAQALINKLMQQYNISVEETTNNDAEGWLKASSRYDGTNNRFTPMANYGVLFYVQELFNVKCWTDSADKKVYIFGRPENVKQAHYFADMIKNTFVQEYNHYKKHNKVGRSSKHSFMIGYYKKVCEKMKQMIEENKKYYNTTQESKTLMVTKQGELERRFRKLNMRLGKRSRTGSRAGDHSAYGAGSDAASNFKGRRGVEGGYSGAQQLR